MKWIEQRDLLLTKAAQDEKAMEVLVVDEGVADAVVGFHAQQAVEKYLKALLCHLRVNYALTHDLLVLMDALTDAGHPVPTPVANCRRLQPFAVRFRYEDIPVGAPAPLNRLAVLQDVGRARDWVMRLIDTEKRPEPAAPGA